MSYQVVLARRPQGGLTEADLRLQEAPVGSPDPGEVLLRTRYLSIDPFTRIFLDERPLGGAVPGLPIGALLPGAAVAEVVESRAPELSAGDLVEGRIGWRETAVLPAAGLRRLDPGMSHPQAALGILGLPGLTAHTGMITIGQIAEGQTAIISSAAGSVGLVAGQIAKLHGASAIGIAGGAAKCKLAMAHGFDACIDYHAPGLEAALRDACPKGADLYLDNVGGLVSLAAYGALRRGALVALCGLLSLYEGTGGATPEDLGQFMRRIMLGGLTIRAFATIETVAPAAASDLARWLHSGAIRLPETIVEGLQAAPAAFVRLLHGQVQGKIIVRTA